MKIVYGQSRRVDRFGGIYEEKAKGDKHVGTARMYGSIGVW